METIGGKRGTDAQTEPLPGRQGGGGPRGATSWGGRGPPTPLPGVPDGCKARRRLGRSFSSRNGLAWSQGLG